MSTPTSRDSVLCTNLDSSGRSIECMDPQIVEIEGYLTSGIDSMALTTADPGNIASPASICASANLKDKEAPVALSPPAFRLPFDVLESIFLECTGAFQFSITSPLHPSVTISRVCANWRSAALQCTALWAKLQINFPIPVHRAGYTPLWHQSIAKLEKALEVWVDRSGASPMTMIVTSGPAEAFMPVSSEVNEARLSLIHAIKRSSTKWSKFVLDIAVGPDCEVLLELMQFTSASVPRLKTISLQVSCLSLVRELTIYDKVQGVLSTSGIFLTPSLRSMRLHGICGITAATAIHLWPPLTHLDMSCTPPAGVPKPNVFDLFRYFQAIPTLEDVSASVQRQSINTNSNYAPIEFPNIKRITLVGSYIPQGLGQFLRLPALQELRLYVIHLSERYDGSGLVNFILHFGAQLKALTFFLNSVSRSSLIKIFENLPGVETLILEAYRSEPYSIRRRSEDSPGVDCYLFTELTVGTRAVGTVDGVEDEAPLRCPQLRRLEVTFSPEVYTDCAVEVAFVEFVGSRSLRGTQLCIGKCRLEHVTIVLHKDRRFWTEGVLDALKKMCICLNLCIARYTR